MAAKQNTVNPIKSFIILGVIIVIMFGSVGIGALFGGGSFTPKLALDLAGGTQLILTPKLDSGEQVDDAALSQAIEVIRQRVDASGVAEAEITKQGGQNIVVGIPGEKPSDETVELISKAAKMLFRPVILTWAPTDETNTQVNQKNLAAWVDYLKQNADTSPSDDSGTDGSGTEETSTEFSGTAEAAGAAGASNDQAGTGQVGTMTFENGKTLAGVTESQALDILKVDNSLIEGFFNNDSSATVSTTASTTPKTTKAETTSSNTEAGDTPTTATADPNATDTSASDATSSAELAKENAKPLLTDKEKSADTASGTPSSYSYLTDSLEKQFKELNCLLEENRKGGEVIAATDAIVTCDKDSGTKYLLGPATVKGDEIASASSGLRGTSGGGVTNEWVVNIKFTESGDDAFIKSSDIIKKLEVPRNEFAITLDGLVISAPSIKPDINFVKGNGVEISGGSSGFKQDDANLLANQLSFGALPLSFAISSNEQVSASLGSEQLEKGLLAGLFGLLLVVIYSFFQYHILGLVTVGSLGMAGVVIYGAILVLSMVQGYRLSLPSIIGVIVAIGVTADSFIVYFERLKDEIRDGRTLDQAIARGWKRAIRTILASDAVNFICAFVLYFLAVGGVRGFAFTLGLTTLIDLIIVVLFTHPIVYLLAQIPFFRFGHPMSGLSPKRLGAHKYVDYATAKHDFIEQKLALLEKYGKRDDDEEDEDDFETVSKVEEVDELEDDWANETTVTPKKKKKPKAEKKKPKVDEIEDDWIVEDEPKKPKKTKPKKEKKVKETKPKKDVNEIDIDDDGWGE
jgi:preprotein translocase subunit SecD